MNIILYTYKNTLYIRMSLKCYDNVTTVQGGWSFIVKNLLWIKWFAHAPKKQKRNHFTLEPILIKKKIWKLAEWEGVRGREKEMGWRLVGRSALMASKTKALNAPWVPNKNKAIITLSAPHYTAAISDRILV